MTALSDITQHLDEVLESHLFRDYGPNGLQVEGKAEVARVVTGVSANMALLEAAASKNADAVVVHHGLIWGPGIARIDGSLANRLRFLLQNHMSLIAYHLPLDKHPALGNNAGMADALYLPAQRQSFGDVRGHALGAMVDMKEPVSRDELVARVEKNIALKGHAPFVFAHGKDAIGRVGLCTGAAGDLVEAAKRAGCDAYITGELSERAGALARELKITLIAAGHYATEVFGPKRLATELQETFTGLSVEFIDVPSVL